MSVVAEFENLFMLIAEKNSSNNYTREEVIWCLILWLHVK